MSNVYICPDFIGCQSCKRRLDFSSDARGNNNVPVVRLKVGRDFEDDSFQEYGEFTLDTGANWTVISIEAAAKLGIDVEKWGTMTILKGIGGRVPALKGEVSVRMANIDVAFTIPVLVPLRNVGEVRLLGREGILGRFTVILHKNGLCLMPQRRSEPRTEVYLSVRLRKDARDIAGEVTNISRNGLMVRTVEKPDFAESFDITLIDGESRYTLSGEIAWAVDLGDHYLTGIKLTDSPESYVELVEREYSRRATR